MKPTIYLLMSNIGLVRGGITKASLKQASLFAELGFDTNILTFNFNPRYPLIREELLKMNKIHKDVNIVNIYEHMEGFTSPEKVKKKKSKFSLTKFTKGFAYDKRPEHNAYRIYENGIYRKYISLENDDTIDFIDYHDENQYRTKREIYDPWGNVRKVEYMDLSLNKPRQSVFYNTKGEAYLTIWTEPKTGEFIRMLFFNKDSLEKVYVKDDFNYKVDWVNSIVKDKSIVISDTRTTDKLLLNIDDEKVAKVWRLHSNHLGPPYPGGTEIAPKVKTGYKNIDKFDVAIFLSEEQRADITNQIGIKTTYCVVPHYHEVKLNNRLFNNFYKNKDKNLAVIVSRYSSIKRIDHSIKAFAKVVQEVPNARLEIWGSGRQKDNYISLINELGLENHVFLKGFTHDSDAAFQKGLFSLFTSKTEGFGLSCLESMSNETPVISYDFKYGPRDMIVNNDNGFLINNGDNDELASKMIYLFKNPTDAIKMGKRARKYVSKNFSLKVNKEKWLEVINKAIEIKFK
ncbi:glycosyltransferase [Oceanobacillus sp. CAU 1775]